MGRAPRSIPFSGPPYGRTTARGTRNHAPDRDHDVGNTVPRWRAIPHEIRELCQLTMSKLTPNCVKKRFPENKYLCGPRL